ncbi:MAG: chemoreceptor glutamine deamidase CheD [Pseudomonadota bacterium]|nr:chemoreceptor glutamine deamidase CheD [Pseudomonadota bacterium]
MTASELLEPESYFDRTFQCRAWKLLPGQYHVGGREAMLVTVLGSCVSACLYDSGAGIGGMNHFMLPSSELGGATGGSVPARLGIHAMELLINALVRQGARRSSLRAKIFGGGAVLQGLTASNVGERNAEFALTYLRTEGIPVVAQDLLDVFPRKIYFFPGTARVMVRKLRKVDSDLVRNAERAYAESLRNAPVAGDVELFA